jgi:hypothetical protein
MSLMNERTRRTVEEIQRSGNMDALSRKVYGLSAADLNIVGKIGAKLGHPGQALEKADIANLQRIYAGQLPAKEVEAIAAKLNTMPSGSRQNIFASILAGDVEGVRVGVPSTPEARQSLGFIQNLSGFSLAEDVDAKLDAGRSKSSDFQIQRPAADNYSTRALLERQIGPTRDEALDSLSSDDSKRQVLSAQFDRSAAKVFGPESEDMSLGETVAHVFDMQWAEDSAKEHNLISEDAGDE